MTDTAHSTASPATAEHEAPPARPLDFVEQPSLYPAVAGPPERAPAGSGSGSEAAGPEATSSFAKPPTWSFGGPPAAPTAPPTDNSSVPNPFPVVPRAPADRTPQLHASTGRRRSPVLLALRSLLTLGLGTLVWHALINREVRDFDPRMHARPTRSLLAVAVPWLAGIGAGLVGLAALLGDRMPSALHPQINSTVAWLLLLAPLAIPYATLLFPPSAVATVMTAERTRQAQEHAGLTSDVQVRPVRLPLVLAVPVLGAFVYPALLQARLNRAWDMVEVQQRLRG